MGFFNRIIYMFFTSKLSPTLLNRALGMLLCSSLLLLGCETGTGPSDSSEDSSSEFSLSLSSHEKDQYVFVAEGLTENEIITPMDIAVRYGEDAPFSLATTVEMPDDGSSVLRVNFNGNEPRGTWNISAKGNEGFYAETSFEYEPAAPKLNFANSQFDASTGYMNYIFFGSGWDLGENLSFSTQGPDSTPQTISLGTANEFGYSVQVPVPFSGEPNDGLYTFTMTGELNGSVQYEMTCLAGVCQ